MTFDSLPVLSQHPTNRDSYQRLIAQCLVTLIAVLGCLLLSTPSALAELNDDHFDGNIFALYAGNGSLVPPRVTLADSMKAHK
ncbi:MAG: thioredoxin family protein, partial [Coleofasciculus chthonoplastes F1-TOW-03]